MDRGTQGREKTIIKGQERGREEAQRFGIDLRDKKGVEKDCNLTRR